MDRYEIIKNIIDDWFSLELKLEVLDIMPHLVFLYEENLKLKEKIKDINLDENTDLW